MSSRADYLSKYLSKEAPKKTKKKSKKHSSADVSPPIIIEGLGVFAKSNPMDATSLDHDNLINTLPDPDSEFDPARVELSSTRITKGGFRRIDNGEPVNIEQSSPEQTSPEQTSPKTFGGSDESATVYRDLSGKIVDLQAKRAEIKARKEDEARREELAKELVNTGELDRIRQQDEAKRIANATRFDVSKSDKEYKEYMSHKERFEDPLAASLSTSSLAQASATNRPVYNGQHPVNRFKIQAGHFWDGIDRGNGFEERLVRARDLMYVKQVTDRGAQESYTEYDFE